MSTANTVSNHRGAWKRAAYNSRQTEKRNKQCSSELLSHNSVESHVWLLFAIHTNWHNNHSTLLQRKITPTGVSLPLTLDLNEPSLTQGIDAFGISNISHLLRTPHITSILPLSRVTFYKTLLKYIIFRSIKGYSRLLAVLALKVDHC